MSDSEDDNDLIKGFSDLQTRPIAYRNLVNRYQKRVYSIVRKMVIDHDDADDVTQEVFIKVWRNLQNFRGDSGLFTWIYRIAINESISFLNKKKTRFFLPIADYERSLVSKIEATPLQDGDEIMRKLQLAILKLPDKQRLVFNMKYFEDITYEEMSEVLGTSVGALKASYHLAVKKIEAFLTEG